MKVLIEIPLEHYELFVAACDTTSREYTILKNAIILLSPGTNPNQRIVQFMCDEDEAHKLLRIAGLVCHEVTGWISAAIDSLHTPILVQTGPVSEDSPPTEPRGIGNTLRQRRSIPVAGALRSWGSRLRGGSPPR